MTADFTRRTPNGLVWVRGKKSRAILEDIWKHPGATTVEITTRLGDVTENGVSHALSHLVELGLVSRHKDHSYGRRGVRYCYHLQPNVAKRAYKAPEAKPEAKPEPQVVAMPLLRITDGGRLVVATDEPELPLEQPTELLPAQVAEIDRLRKEIITNEEEIEMLYERLGEYADMDEELSNMAREIADLQQWKTDAIAKYPDLDVDPLLLKARQIVVDLGQTPYSPDELLLGHQDDDYTVQYTLSVLRAAQQKEA